MEQNKNLKLGILAVVFSGIFLGLVWWKIEFLNKLIFGVSCEGFAGIGCGLMFLVEFSILVIIVSVMDGIILARKLKDNKLPAIGLTIFCIIFIAFIIVEVSYLIRKDSEQKAEEKAYYDCLKDIEDGIIKVDPSYCELYNPDKYK